MEINVNLEPLKKYEAVVISSDTDATYVAEGVGEIKKVIKSIEAQRLSYTKPLDEAKAKLIQDERKATDPLNAILKVLNKKLVDWTLSQEARRREEAERKRKEELAALEAEKQRQLEIAAKTDGEEAARAVEEIEKNAARLEVAPIEIKNTVKTDTGGWTTQKRWKAKVVDETLVPREFLIVDTVKLNKYATAMKETAKVPGVEFFFEMGGVSR